MINNIDENKIKELSKIFNDNIWTTLHRNYTHILFSSNQEIHNQEEREYYEKLCCDDYIYDNINFSISGNFQTRPNHMIQLSNYVVLILKFEPKYFRKIINIFDIDFSKTKILEKISEENKFVKYFLSYEGKIKNYQKLLEDINIPFEFE